MDPNLNQNNENPAENTVEKPAENPTAKPNNPSDAPSTGTSKKSDEVIIKVHSDIGVESNEINTGYTAKKISIGNSLDGVGNKDDKQNGAGQPIENLEDSEDKNEDEQSPEGSANNEADTNPEESPKSEESPVANKEQPDSNKEEPTGKKPETPLADKPNDEMPPLGAHGFNNRNNPNGNDYEEEARRLQERQQALRDQRNHHPDDDEDEEPKENNNNENNENPEEPNGQQEGNENNKPEGEQDPQKENKEKGDEKSSESQEEKNDEKKEGNEESKESKEESSGDKKDPKKDDKKDSKAGDQNKKGDGNKKDKPKNNGNDNKKKKNVNPIQAKKQQLQAAAKKKVEKAKQAAERMKKIKKIVLKIVTSPAFWIAVGVILLMVLMIVLIIGVFTAIAGSEGDGDDSTNYSNGYYSSICAAESSDNVYTFIHHWESSSEPPTCDNNTGYKAFSIGDGTVSIYYGLTNYSIGSTVTENYLDSHTSAKRYFRTSCSAASNQTGKYCLEINDCVPKEVIEEIQIINMESSYIKSVEESAERVGVELAPFQIDALVSFNYQTGSFSNAEYADSILNAYKDDGYEGLWNIIKTRTDSVGADAANRVDGLKKRRKGEFALFVTGDYTDQGKFYSRSTENYDDYDSEGVMSRINSCTEGGSGDSSGLQSNGSYTARVSRALRTNSAYYVQDETNYGNGGLEGECSWYARYRASELLKQAGSTKAWTSQPNGNGFCYTAEVNNGTFKTSTNYRSAKEGALISWSYGQYGHVAVVEKVDSDAIYVSEGGLGYGDYTAAGYNWRDSSAPNYIRNYVNSAESRKEYCEINNTGCYHYSRIPMNEISNYAGSFICYVYLLDS